MTSNAILTLNLTEASYVGRQVLGPINFGLARAEVVAVCGPSGIGKSTLLRIIAGLHKNYSGTCDVGGKLAIVLQEPTLLPWRTALQNITLLAGCDEAQAQEALSDVGLGDRGSALPDELSLGQQRRLALARAVAAKPDLLLMDEPFVSLDAATADEMMGLVERLHAQHGFAAVLVTHAANEASRLADRILRLDGQPAQLVA
ncbi:ABC transporter ATP-binding protein [Marivivens aquimaris]|uniref:ABC transporter ATP-binding protein n=1 Tax=Marivivens aquimaris TaxID=2774876 RepID=UPI002AD5338D|nr:ATP-binding cassette domain-containing protein [Marivivens aquimaris]